MQVYYSHVSPWIIERHLKTYTGSSEGYDTANVDISTLYKIFVSKRVEKACEKSIRKTKINLIDFLQTSQALGKIS